MMPWYGEFSGKYLTSAALAYIMTPDARLRGAGDYVVTQLAAAQDTDGYLGVWPDSEKLSGKTPYGDKTWDVWSHYHNMLGLWLWHKATGSETARKVLVRAAQCLYDFFIVNGRPLDEDKDGTDTAVGHIFALMYKDTGKAEYMEMVNKAFHAFEEETGGDYYRAGLSETPFFMMKRTRWECLHAIETIKVMYDITGDEKCRRAFFNIWESIARYDRHNTGGFSSGERASGNPYDPGAIETCATIAWMALTVDMLDLSDDPRIADELEMSTWNALLGAQLPGGRGFTYNTPMTGERRSSAHDIVFQALSGSPELNCCSVNGARGFGMIGQWGVKPRGEEITVNYYGASDWEVATGSGKRMRIIQTGSYPFGNDISLKISTDPDFAGKLRLRFPGWSPDTQVIRNGMPLAGALHGSYFSIEHISDGDRIDLYMDTRPRFWLGEQEAAGRAALYSGPILLACDQRFNNGRTGSSIPLKQNRVFLTPCETPDTLMPQPYLLVKASDGENSVVLCDFASAGQTGTTYDTWLDVSGTD